MKGTIKHIKEIAVGIKWVQGPDSIAFGEVLRVNDGREILLWGYRKYDNSGGLGYEFEYQFRSLQDAYPSPSRSEDGVLLPLGFALTKSARKYLVALAAERLAKYMAAREDEDKDAMESIMLAKMASLEDFLGLPHRA